MVAQAPPSREQLLHWLGEVMDPEVPVLSVVELGIVRDVAVEGDVVEVSITPTYSGCPAMKMIEDDIVAGLEAHGVREVRVRTVFSPAWTTDWMSDEAKAKLRAYGIAPPSPTRGEELVPLLRRREMVPCPYCDSARTELRSEFGSTACKSIYYCTACQQPFELFKSI